MKSKQDLQESMALVPSVESHASHLAAAAAAAVAAEELVVVAL